MLPKDCLPTHGACLVEGKSYLFDEKPPTCPYKLVRNVQQEQEEDKLVLDRSLGLLLNPTISRKLEMPGCQPLTIFATTLEGIFISMDRRASSLLLIQALDLRETEDLLPTLTFMSHENSKVIQSVKMAQEVGNCDSWMRIRSDHDYLHPPLCQRGRRVGQII